jgi:tRNA threonylcarbamoyladenosine biosynthesis protein TsaB
MLIVGIDSSLPLMSVALADGGALLGAVALEGKDSRNEKLLPAIDWLLSEAGAAKNDVGLLAVTRGPGSFTGVRIGLATAQGLALALDVPVCAMSTHEAVAHGAVPGVRALVCDDAGRGEYYVSSFDGSEPVRGPWLCSRAELDTLVEGHDRVLVIKEVLRSANVAALATGRAHQIQVAQRLDRYAEATPIYVRLAEAEVRLQQQRNV